MLPYPSINFIPKVFVDQDEPLMTAFTAMLDAIAEGDMADIKGMSTWFDPARMPSQFLEELGYLLSSNILSSDSDTVRRKKIFNAYSMFGTAGLWTYVKPNIDAITGYSASIYTDTDDGWWVELSAYDAVGWVTEGTTPDYHVDESGNFHVDESGNFLIDGTYPYNTPNWWSVESIPGELHTGFIEMGNDHEVFYPCVVYIDLGDAGALSAPVIAQVVYYFTYQLIFAYYKIVIGYTSGGKFTIYDVI